MFTDQGSKAALDGVREYLILNLFAMPPEAQDKLTPVALDQRPADALVNGMEYLYSALLQCPAMPNADTAWQALGQAAYEVAQSNLWLKRDRALEIMTYAAFKIEGAAEGMEPPPVPALLDDFRVIPAPPEPVPTPAPGEALPAYPAPSQPEPPGNPSPPG